MMTHNFDSDEYTNPVYIHTKVLPYANRYICGQQNVHKVRHKQHNHLWYRLIQNFARAFLDFAHYDILHWSKWSNKFCGALCLPHQFGKHTSSGLRGRALQRK